MQDSIRSLRKKEKELNYFLNSNGRLVVNTYVYMSTGAHHSASNLHPVFHDGSIHRLHELGLLPALCVRNSAHNERYLWLDVREICNGTRT